MKKFYSIGCDGFTLIEMLMVFVIIGALASIAIPHYSTNKDKAHDAQCRANRYNIELDEKAYYSEHGSPKLTIDERYKCTSGGVYVWIVSDPEDPDYPKLGCSVHYIGEGTPTEPGGGDETSQTEQNNQAATDAIQDLINYTNGLDLNKGITNSMITKLTSALNSVQQDQNSSAVNSLSDFANYVGVQKGKKIPENEADILISRAQSIIAQLS